MQKSVICLLLGVSALLIAAERSPVESMSKPNIIVFFDLSKDPTELTNLAQNPEYASVLWHMQSGLDDYLTKYPSERPTRIKKPGN